MKKQIVFFTILVITVILAAWNKPGSFTPGDEVRAFNMKDIKSNKVKFNISQKAGATNVTAQANNDGSELGCYPDTCPDMDTCFPCVSIVIAFTGNSRDPFSHLTALSERALPKLNLQIVNEANGMMYNALVYNETLKDVVFNFRPAGPDIANSTFKYVLNGQAIGFGHKLVKRLRQ